MNWIQASIAAHIEVSQTLMQQQDEIITICDCCLKAIQAGYKIILAGNGGSASDAQHIAAEFVGRFVKERLALPAIALTTDTSALTAISNDYGFEQVFARQLSGLGQAGDVFIGISTSGNSPNILAALEVARTKGITSIGLLGRTGGKAKEVADYSLVIPSEVTARIQEMHILVGHLICEYVDEAFCKRGEVNG